eukprot:scaffold10794_cov66-Phaeocystis_antarctica.AAC.1
MKAPNRSPAPSGPAPPPSSPPPLPPLPQQAVRRSMGCRSTPEDQHGELKSSSPSPPLPPLVASPPRSPLVAVLVMAGRSPGMGRRSTTEH